MIGTNFLRMAIAGSVLLCATAQAQLFRAYLASDGNDANPCTLPAPCRLLPAALNAVADGGEIWMLDSANYNTATVYINKSVSILAIPGAVGSVVALNGGPAISITADSLTVALRNLVIGTVAGAPLGSPGVTMSGSSTLLIEDSLIANLVGGVLVSGGGKLKMANTTLRDNKGDFAVQVSQGARAEISRTQMLGNGGGVKVETSPSVTTTASISDSVISGGSSGIYLGVRVYAGVGGLSRISVTRTTIERTELALDSLVTQPPATAEIHVGTSLIVDNTYAWYQYGAGSKILSLGDNQFSGNTTSSGVLTPLAPQ